MLVRYGGIMELNGLEQRTHERVQDIMRHLVAKGGEKVGDKGYTVKRILTTLKDLEQFGLLKNEAFIRATSKTCDACHVLRE